MFLVVVVVGATSNGAWGVEAKHLIGHRMHVSKRAPRGTTARTAGCVQGGGCRCAGASLGLVAFPGALR